ncbi:MAG TPA: carbonic anhydrase [Chlamydiales bacterium]|nr:carbonic anhydrase [Chlamydiales bacterium]
MIGLLRFFAFVFPILGTFAVTPDEALKRLMEGNNRYIKEELIHPDTGMKTRKSNLLTQYPYATILGCSDSRVPPELIFDEGIGDLFVVRVAGNVVGPIEQDSIEYAAIYLGSSLILVMGHENCGAVKAVIEGNTKDIEDVAVLIQPAVNAAKKQGGSAILKNAIQKNAENVAHQLQRSPVLSKLIQEGKIRIVPAYYNFLSGKVELITAKGE